MSKLVVHYHEEMVSATIDANGDVRFVLRDKNSEAVVFWPKNEIEDLIRWLAGKQGWGWDAGASCGKPED